MKSRSAFRFGPCPLTASVPASTRVAASKAKVTLEIVVLTAVSSFAAAPKTARKRGQGLPAWHVEHILAELRAPGIRRERLMEVSMEAFRVTNLRRSPRRVIKFYNRRGTAEQWSKEGKTGWSSLECGGQPRVSRS